MLYNFKIELFSVKLPEGDRGAVGAFGHHVPRSIERLRKNRKTQFITTTNRKTQVTTKNRKTQFIAPFSNGEFPTGDRGAVGAFGHHVRPDVESRRAMGPGHSHFLPILYHDMMVKYKYRRNTCIGLHGGQLCPDVESPRAMGPGSPPLSPW